MLLEGEMMRVEIDTVKGKALVMLVEEEVDALRRDEGEVQDNDEDDELTARFLGEHRREQRREDQQG